MFDDEGGRRPVVGVVFGGRSPEHGVSIQTARSIVDALDPAEFECLPVYIAPSGQWRVGTSFDDLVGGGDGGRGVLLPADPTEGGLLPKIEPPGRDSLPVTARLDVVIPAIHGV